MEAKAEDTEEIRKNVMATLVNRRNNKAVNSINKEGNAETMTIQVLDSAEMSSNLILLLVMKAT